MTKKEPFNDIMKRFKIWEQNRVEKELDNLKNEVINREGAVWAIDIINKILNTTTESIVMLKAFMDTIGITLEDIRAIINDFGEYCNKDCKDDKDAIRELELLEHFFAFIEFVSKDIDKLTKERG